MHLVIKATAASLSSSLYSLVSGMQIIQVNLTSEDLQPITSGSKVEFTYSVTWAATPIHFNRRFERYLDYNFFEHQVQHVVLLSDMLMQESRPT